MEVEFGLKANPAKAAILSSLYQWQNNFIELTKQMNAPKPPYKELEDKIRRLENEISVLKLQFQKVNPIAANASESNTLLVLEKILDISPFGIVYILASGEIVLYNKKAQELFSSYTIHSTKDLENWRITTPDGELVPNEKLLFETVKRTKKPVFNIEHSIEINGLKKYILLSGNPVVNEDGDFLGTIVVFEDITHRKQSEIERKEIDEKFSTIFNTSPTAYTLYENNGRLIDVNPAFCQMTGFSHNEVVGKTTMELNLISHNEYLRMQESMNPKDGTFDNFELEMTRKDGTIFTVHLSRKIITINGKQYGLGAAIDINKTKQTEKKLIEYSQRLEIASNSAQLGIWDWNIKENTMLWDSRMFELYGIATEDFSNTIVAWENGLHPEDKQRAIDECNKALRGEAEYDTSFRIVQPKGIILFLKANAIVIRDSDGNPLRMIGINRDITESKIAEEQLIKAKAKLEENELRLKIALRTSKAGIWDWNIAANTFYWSDEYYSLFGLSNEVIPGFESWTKSLHPDDVEIASKRIQESIENQTELVSDYRIILPTSEILWIRAVGKTYYENNKPIRMVGICLDITESKIAEEAIRQSEDNHRRFMDESTLGIRILTQEGKTVYINQALLEIYGFVSPEEFNQTPTTGKYTSQEYSRHQQRKEMRKKGIEIPSNYEIDIVTKSAQIKHLEVIRKEIIWDNSLHYQVIYMDITQRKHTEELLKQKTYEIEVQNEEYKQLNEELYIAKTKAEESDKLKTAFLHNISHEIRTPMNAIIGFSELLTKPGTPADKGKYYADIVNQSCNQLLMVITDIVNIATIEAGLTKIEVEEFNVNSVIKFVHQQFVIKAEKLNINLTYNCKLSDEEAIIKSDKTKFTEILINLIGNALKFTKHGKIEFGYRIVDNFIEFFVADTGIGIPKEFFDEIFFRFRQVENTTTRQYGGSGLGLSISKAYVELLGGKIWLVSEPEKGSTFYFTIPYAPVKKDIVAKVNIEPEIKLASIRSKTILIAEDEDSNFMLLEEILSVTDWKIIRATDGVEAVDFCKENADIDLVLMDLKMPIMDGYEATKQIKSFRPELKIMAQTAYASENDKNKALECGCIDVITKPINETLFLLKIEETLLGKNE
jgi:PAS domain S-box-containing protein